MSTKPNLLAEFGLNREALAKLSKRKQLLFALFLFDRILPLLLSFSKRTGFDIAEFLKARSSLWDSLTKGSEKKKSNWSSTRRICLKNAPDTAAYDDKFVSHALNASLSLANILNFAQKGRLDDILEVAAWVRDSIDLHIQSLDPSQVSSPDVCESIRHPLMKEELDRQRRDIGFLVTLPERLTEEQVSSLMRRAKRQPPIIPINGGRAAHL